jgi:HD superfamily phosphohydrolase
VTRAPGRNDDDPRPSIRDAVHGPIDISDTSTVFDASIIDRLVQSRPVQRLRRIKQLGFASQSYVAADHSRYAHSIGTMHVLRKLLSQVGAPRSTFLTGLIHQYKEVYKPNEPVGADFLYEHMLVAALLQDIGELPYQNATKGFFLPDEDLRAWVSQKIEQDVTLWPAKPVFTLACLFESEIQAIIEPLNIQFVAFLVTADYWTEPSWISRFLPIRHMLNGEIDADRIDYVHRDAHHTIGMLGTSGDVIAAIMSYDDLGPICSDPAPLGNFLATRAHLYSIVYFAPQNRFRVMLLKTILQGVRESPQATAALPVLASKYISIESFLELDDVRLEAEITTLSRGPLKARMSKRTSTALVEFTTASSSYQHFWLRETTHTSSANGQATPIPQDVFFEVFTAGRTTKSGIRFAMPTPVGSTELAEINDVNGPYFEVVSNPRATLPILGDVLVFYPKTGRGRDLATLKVAFINRTLRATLISKAKGEWGGFPADTRRMKGFNGAAIFISYCVDDIVHVRRLVGELHRRRRRYYAIIEPNQGVGGTTAQNSIDGVMKSEAAIIVASRSYQSRCSTQLNGNIMQEIRTMHDRRIPGPAVYPVVPISVHAHNEIANIPWSLLGMNTPPYTGSLLENASDSDLHATVEAVLLAIDTEA